MKTPIWRRVLLLPVCGFAVFILVNGRSFLHNVVLYASGGMAGRVFRDQWQLFLVSSLAFLLFLVPLSFRRRASWKQKGVFGAFILSLFLEMYGIPLSLFAASAWLFPRWAEQTSRQRLQIVTDFRFLGAELNVDFWALFGYIMVAVGAVIIAVAWWRLYHSTQPFETGGLYAVSRHPQYLGFFFLVWGWTISWPSLLTLSMATLLTVVYHRAARKEEAELEGELGEAYAAYRRHTPMYA